MFLLLFKLSLNVSKKNIQEHAVWEHCFPLPAQPFKCKTSWPGPFLLLFLYVFQVLFLIIFFFKDFETFLIAQYLSCYSKTLCAFQWMGNNFIGKNLHFFVYERECTLTHTVCFDSFYSGLKYNLIYFPVALPWLLHFSCMKQQSRKELIEDRSVKRA